MGRTPIGDAAKRELIAFRVGLDLKKKFEEWPDGREYLRECIRTRYTGNAEELKRRASELRAKAQDLMAEAQECDRMADADATIMDAKFDRYILDYNTFNRKEYDRDTNIGWLMARFEIERDVAMQVMAYIGDGAGAER